MIGLINKFLSKDENSRLFYPVFQRLRKNTEVEKIFKSISEFSEKSEVRYVGGCVRKIINQEDVDDIDLATNIEPKKVIEILKKNNIEFYETGVEHGTITARINGQKFEITSLREDINQQGRHTNIRYTIDWKIDSQRRDFTMNSIYLSSDGTLHDYYNGQEHLANQKLQFIGDVEKRIQEDYLRILRY